MSQYLTFLEQLFHDGRLALAEINEPTPDEIRDGQQFAAEFEKDYRLELAGDAPAFSPEPFNWAAVNLYRIFHITSSASLSFPHQHATGRQSAYWSFGTITNQLLVLPQAMPSVSKPTTRQIEARPVLAIDWCLIDCGFLPTPD